MIFKQVPMNRGIFLGFINRDMKDPQAWATRCGLHVLVSTDPTPLGDLKHVSVSRGNHYPTWEEIKAARERFFDENKPVMMILPRKGLYVNLHKNCFHLWEAPFQWEIM